MKHLKIILLLAVAYMATSCLTVDRIKRNCDTFAKVCIAETVKETVYRDTTIYLTDTVAIKMPADTVTIKDTVTIYNGLAWLPTVYREFGLVWVKAGVDASVLNVAAGIIDSTLLKPVTDTVIIKEAIKEQTTTNTPKPIEVKYIPKFYKFTFRVFWVLIVVFMGWVIIKGKYRIVTNTISQIKKSLSRNS